jgi:hypothetical protein
MDEIDLDSAFGFACEGGNRVMVDMLIKQGVKGWKFGFISACFGGYIDIVNMMIDKGVNDWNLGVWCGGQVKCKQVVEFMLSMSGGNINKKLLLYVSLKADWSDLIAMTIYNFSVDSIMNHGRDDFLVIFRDNCNDSIYDVQVKMFDRNLFGFVSKYKSNKRKR